jgi:NAD(P)-dependent dehydrogenase (short-subunit alcohol dehydrogenase family)
MQKEEIMSTTAVVSTRSTDMALTKTFIVTGGNTGLGFECAAALAEDSSILVIMACRDVQKGEQAARRVRGANGNAEVLPLDLSSQASIRAFVEVFRRGQFRNIFQKGFQQLALHLKATAGE